VEGSARWKVRLRATPRTPEFMAAYDDAKSDAPKPTRNGIGADDAIAGHWSVATVPTRSNSNGDFLKFRLR
jgi:hypothetical protein